MSLKEYISFDDSVSRIANKYEIPKYRVKTVLVQFVKTLKVQVDKGNIIKIRKLGIFKLNRKGRILLRRERMIKKTAYINGYSMYNKRYAYKRKR